MSWTNEESFLLARYILQLGNNWSKISFSMSINPVTVYEDLSKFSIDSCRKQFSDLLALNSIEKNDSKAVERIMNILFESQKQELRTIIADKEAKLKVLENENRQAERSYESEVKRIEQILNQEPKEYSDEELSGLDDSDERMLDQNIPENEMARSEIEGQAVDIVMKSPQKIPYDIVSFGDTDLDIEGSDSMDAVSELIDLFDDLRKFDGYSQFISLSLDPISIRYPVDLSSIKKKLPDLTKERLHLELLIMIQNFLMVTKEESSEFKRAQVFFTQVNSLFNK